MTPDAERWKWVAGSLVAMMLALLLPSIGWFVDSRNRVTHDEFNVIADRQQQVLQRLAVVEIQLLSNAALIEELQEQLREHETSR